MRWLALSIVFLGACGGAATGAPPPATADDPDSCAVAVRIEELVPEVETDDTVPRMVLTVVRICERDGTATAALPPEAGVCTPEAPERDAIAAATCWWAGAGAVVEVVRVGDELVARRTARDEMAGPGAPEDVARVPLPPDAETHGLGL